MDQIYIQESRKEVLVVLDKHYPDKLTAMEAAVKILQREVTRERAKPNRNDGWNPYDGVR